MAEAFPTQFHDLAALEELPPKKWRDLCEAFGYPPGLNSTNVCGARIHDALAQGVVFGDELIDALNAIYDLGTDMGREQLVETARALNIDSRGWPDEARSRDLNCSALGSRNEDCAGHGGGRQRLSFPVSSCSRSCASPSGRSMRGEVRGLRCNCHCWFTVESVISASNCRPSRLWFLWPSGPLRLGAAYGENRGSPIHGCVRRRIRGLPEHAPRVVLGKEVARVRHVKCADSVRRERPRIRHPGDPHCAVEPYLRIRRRVLFSLAAVATVAVRAAVWQTHVSVRREPGPTCCPHSRRRSVAHRRA
jgi:hypothetical protein